MHNEKVQSGRPNGSWTGTTAKAFANHYEELKHRGGGNYRLLVDSEYPKVEEEKEETQHNGVTREYAAGTSAR